MREYGDLDESPWVQYAVTAPPPDQGCSIYADLHTLAQRQLDAGVVGNFFFMRKAPGLRLRFEVLDAAKSDRLHDDVSGWMTHAGLRGERRGIYEPETRLFGGESSMEYVHSLFTIDSLAWLYYEATSRHDSVSSRICRSLELLVSLFDGLSLDAFEDVGVWDAIVREWGRSPETRHADTPEFSQAADEVVRFWQSAWYGQVDATTDVYGQLLRSVARQWYSSVLQGPQPSIGTRRVAARVVVFHWNRGSFPPVEQALVASALAARAD